MYVSEILSLCKVWVFGIGSWKETFLMQFGMLSDTVSYGSVCIFYKLALMIYLVCFK